MEQHADHTDQLHQLLLALGSLGRMLAAGDPQRDRVRDTLHVYLERAVGENAVSEAQFQRDVDVAQGHIDRMTPQEWHQW